MPDPLHVAYLFSRYPVVSQTFCDSEMLALEKIGTKITIGSLNPPPDSFRHERLDQLNAETIYPAPPAVMHAPDDARPPVWKKMHALATEHEARFGADTKPVTRARNACYFATQFTRRNVQHVHVHFANRATHTALFLKEAGFTYSFTAHAQDFMVDLANDNLLREMMRQAEFVVAVSDYSRDMLAAIDPQSAYKLHRIYNGISLDDFARSNIPSKTDRPLQLVSIGRLIEFKGFHVLIDAMAKLKNSNIPAELKIVGEGPWRERLQTQIERLGLSDTVTLCGTRSQDQVRSLLADADAFALACLVDSYGASDVLPTVITEAMAAGLPVISTRVAGVPEMVTPEETGLLAPPGDSDALAEALRQLADGSEAWRRQLGETGCLKARAQFDQLASANELMQHFQRVISEPAAPAKADSAIVVMSGCPGTVAARAELSAYVEIDRLRIIAARLGTPDASAMALAAHGGLDFLPDGGIVESIWRSRPHWRAEIDEIRRVLGTGIEGEEFYLQARRAAWLADHLERQPVPHLHAFRSDSVIWVWLASRLCHLTIRLSAVIEQKPNISRSVLAKILGDFSMLSIADQRLATQLNAKDEIELASVNETRHRRIGPIKIRQASPIDAFRKAVRAWAQRIVRS